MQLKTYLTLNIVLDKGR